MIRALLLMLALVWLTWEDRSDNESGFLIERQRGQGAQWETVGSVPPGRTQYQDTGLRAGRTYCYRVKAPNPAGVSAPSNIACGVAH